MATHMEKYFLTLPHESYAEDIGAYRSEFLEHNSSMNGCGSLKITADPIEWIEISRRYMDKEKVPDGQMQATQFLYVRESDKKLCGMILVRHCFNNFPEKFAGHIGYSVCPSMRQRGIATQMLRDCLPFCKSIGLDKVLISCRADNEGSRRVILANGGVYENTVFVPDKNISVERYRITL